jgi:hypothetical protein
MPYNPSAKEFRQRRARLKNKIARLAAKERKKTITDAEREALASCREQLGRLNGLKKKPKVKPTGSAPTPKQGPAAKVTGVVSGGAPGLGKRR